jgi:hypothetical protein
VNSHRPCSHVWHNATVQTPVQCSVQCNENSARSYKNLSVSKLYQNCYKHCYNCETILTSKVTLLNTCKKLKMTHEKQLDLGNKNQRSMRLVM